MKKDKTTRKFLPVTEDVFDKFKALAKYEGRTYSKQLENMGDSLNIFPPIETLLSMEKGDTLGFGNEAIGGKKHWKVVRDL